MTSQKVFLKSNFSSSMVKQKKEKEEKKFLSLHGSLQPRNPISHPMPVIQAVKRASEITSTGTITPSKRSCQTAGYNQCSNVKAATNRGFQVDGIHLTFCHDVLPIFFPLFPLLPSMTFIRRKGSPFHASPFYVGQQQRFNNLRLRKRNL